MSRYYYASISELMKTSPSEDGYVISIIAPGINKEDVDISIEGRKLDVSIPQSQIYGNIRQIFTTDYELSGKQVNAEYVDGIVKISVSHPKDFRKKISVG